MWRRYQQFGTTRDRPWSGRPRVTSNRQDTYIRVDRLRTAILTTRSIPSFRRISPRTVRNRMCERGIRPRRPAIRPVLQQRHRVARFAWCRRHINFTQQDWVRVLFTDESKFHLDSSDSRSREYRRVGERFHDSCVIQRRSLGGGSVMVWSGISSRGRTALVVVYGTLTGIRYRDEIIRPHVLPFVQQHNATLQQDNARPHVALVITDFLIQNNVNVLLWPVMSPDLSPIEHVWDEMQRRLRGLQNQPLTLPDLSRALVRIWNCILQAFFRTLVASIMRRRCQACIDSSGGHTRY